MLDHISLGTHDLARATAFYEDVLAPLQVRVQNRTDVDTAFGHGDDWSLFLYPLQDGETAAAPRMHLALRADSRDAVRAAHARALARGADSVRECAARPEFGADYFGGLFRDPDGHVIELLTRNA